MFPYFNLQLPEHFFFPWDVYSLENAVPLIYLVKNYFTFIYCDTQEAEKQVNFGGFKASLFHIESSRIARDTLRDNALKKTN